MGSYREAFIHRRGMSNSTVVNSQCELSFSSYGQE